MTVIDHLSRSQNSIRLNVRPTSTTITATAAISMARPPLVSLLQVSPNRAKGRIKGGLPGIGRHRGNGGSMSLCFLP